MAKDWSTVPKNEKANYFGCVDRCSAERCSCFLKEPRGDVKETKDLETVQLLGSSSPEHPSASTKKSLYGLVVEAEIFSGPAAG